MSLYDGWKEPQWDDTPITIPRRVLQECEQALSESRGLIQRLESLDGKLQTGGVANAVFHLDARDRRAIAWGYRALASIRQVLGGARLPVLGP